MATRRDFHLRLTPAQQAQAERECEARREIERVLNSLPYRIERAVGGHFYLGGGIAELAQLRAALDALAVPKQEQEPRA
jgi:hypothetical protein